ncbi:MAG TPA: glycyl-radical enzyme activating protein [Oscillospiraceae bacterium]|nr:glycyl-radical enzyme activating protein [Oscillospiraceae bacterium]
MMVGTIYNIQRFSLHDGPGIRTTVFFKGCPLDCVWCHNPESKEQKPEISFYTEKCIKCGYCVSVCPQNCHTLIENQHVLNRINCARCGLCTQRCFAKALVMIGYRITADKVVAQAAADRAFYEKSGGGLTLSGGEPIAQPEFALEIVQKSKEVGLHVCIETCGFCGTGDILKIASFVDLFLFDYKITDPVVHQKYTGVTNESILHNLKSLDDLGKKIILRCPMIPGISLNDGHIEGIIALARSLNYVIEIDLEPYHPLGISKCEQIGKTPAFDSIEFLSKEVLMEYREEITSKTGIAVKII